MKMNNYMLWNYEDLPNESGIYCLENSINGKLYIGQAQDIKTRIRHHFKVNDSLYIHNAIKKYGKEKFNIYILEYVENLEELSEREIYYIKKFSSFKDGYNLTEGGEGLRGVLMSESNKENLRELQNKETWAYNFVKQYYVTASSRLELANQLKDEGYDICDYHIYDALRNKGYSKEFTFGNTKEEAYNNSKNISPKKEISLYLYNYKTERFSPEFNSISDAEQYIRSHGCDICSGHLATAIKNDSKYIKDYLFASSKELLLEKIENFSYYHYFYYIPDNSLFRFEGTMALAKEKLENLGFEVTASGLSSAKLGKQKQHKGFIVATSLKELFKKVSKYNIELSESVYRLAEENNYLNEQSLLDWQDDLNAISVK